MFGKVIACIGILLYSGSVYSDHRVINNPVPNPNSALFTLVSDIDDTVKVAQVNSYGAALWNGLFGQDAFLGMSELYQELAKSADEVIYLSGAPLSLQNQVQKTVLQRLEFPNGKCIFRDWSQCERIEAFKMRNISELLEHHSLPLLLIGDDTQSDPEVFSQLISNLEVSRVRSGYVHQIQGRSLPANLTPYITAFDIALREYKNHLFSAAQVLRVGRAILDSNLPGLLIPDFAYCPANFTYETSRDELPDSSVHSIMIDMEKYIQSICQARGLAAIYEGVFLGIYDVIQ
jgi:hypothetical protein